MKSWIVAIVLATIAIAPVFYLTYYKMGVVQRISRPPSVATIQFETKERSFDLEPGAIFSVRSCEVLDGYKFNLCLRNGKWIVSHLSVATKDKATSFVVDLLNKSPSPTVTLLRSVEDYWIIEFAVIKDGQEENLVDLLRAEELLLD